MAILSADDLSGWWVHTVTVKTHLGASAYGDRFADPVPVPCFVEEVTRLVRDSDGNEAVSSTTVRADLSKAALFPVGSLAATPSGRESRVIALGRLDTGGLSELAGLDHIEVHLA